MTRVWDELKLKVLLEEIETSTKTHLEFEELNGIKDDDSVGQITGYWMYKLKACLRSTPPAGGAA